MKLCTMIGCDKQCRARSYCPMHYARLMRNGDPTIVKEGNRFKLGHPQYKIVRANGKPTSKHGIRNTPAYISWKSMNTRCNNPNASNYIRYGAKGIKICERWKSFVNFYEDMGERPLGTSLDRIDSSGDYEPDNCRWADAKTQARNSGRYIRVKKKAAL